MSTFAKKLESARLTEEEIFTFGDGRVGIADLKECRTIANAATNKALRIFAEAVLKEMAMGLRHFKDFKKLFAEANLIVQEGS